MIFAYIDGFISDGTLMMSNSYFWNKSFRNCIVQHGNTISSITEIHWHTGFLGTVEYNASSAAQYTHWNKSAEYQPQKKLNDHCFRNCLMKLCSNSVNFAGCIILQ